MLERILLIDDSEGEALFVRGRLREAGFEEPLFHIQDSAKAMRYLSGEGEYAVKGMYPLPDVILLDLAMPPPDGYEILRWIRAQPHLSRIAVIVLTGDTDPKRIQKAYELGATSFLAKGATLEEFRNFVEYFRGLARITKTHKSQPGKAADQKHAEEN